MTRGPTAPSAMTFTLVVPARVNVGRLGTVLAITTSRSTYGCKSVSAIRKQNKMIVSAGRCYVNSTQEVNYCDSPTPIPTGCRTQMQSAQLVTTGDELQMTSSRTGFGVNRTLQRYSSEIGNIFTHFNNATCEPLYKTLIIEEIGAMRWMKCQSSYTPSSPLEGLSALQVAIDFGGSRSAGGGLVGLSNPTPFVWCGDATARKLQRRLWLFSLKPFVVA